MTVDAVSFWFGVFASLAGAVYLIAKVTAQPPGPSTASLPALWHLPAIATAAMVVGALLGALFLDRYSHMFPITLFALGVVVVAVCFLVNVGIRLLARSRRKHAATDSS